MPANPINVTPRTIYDISGKDLSKVVLQYPQKKVSDIDKNNFVQEAYGMIEQNAVSIMLDQMPSYMSEFITSMPYAELRKGFVHEEYGVAFSEKYEPIDEAGHVLAPKSAHPQNIYSETISDLFRLVAKVGETKLQHSMHYADPDAYATAIQIISSRAANANRRTMSIFIKAILAGGNFLNMAHLRGGMAFIMNENAKPEENKHPAAKKFYDDFKDDFKKYAGMLNAYFKNKRFYEPKYLNQFDPSGTDVVVSEYTAEQDANSQDNVKEKLRKKYFMSDDGKKLNPPKGLTRAVCLMALKEAISYDIQNLTIDEDVRNGMHFDPSSANHNEEQFMCRADSSNMLLFLNQNDGRNLQEGTLGTTGPAGTIGGGSDLSSKFKAVYPIQFFLPGDYMILDRRCLKFIIFFEASYVGFDPEKVYELKIVHTGVRGGMMKYFPGIRRTATQFVADTGFYSDYQSILKEE